MFNMMRKIINKLKFKVKEDINYFKDNPKQLLWYVIPILVGIVLLMPVPYYITTGGGVIDLDSKIIIDGERDNDGSFNLAYVGEIKGNVLYYILGNIIPSYEIEKKEDVVLSNEDSKDYEFRERMYFKESLNNALYTAYKKALKSINKISNDLVVIYVDDDAKTSINVSDIILKVDDKDVSSVSDVSSVINGYSVNDKVNITVLRNKKEVVTESEIVEIDNEKKLGIVLFDDITYETDPKIKFKFKNRESGPSGGLTIALGIYNGLVDEDITKGYKIVGTGTIDRNGLVGEIGGIKYKLKGAVNDKADYFIVPKENYKEAIEEKNKNNYKINIIGVSTFDDAINELSKLK